MSDWGSSRELVYCHRCENEWYKDEHGLVCPECNSDFTEVIEAAHDPREPEIPEPPFQDHNPWPHPAQPEDNGGVNRWTVRSNGPNSMSISGTFYSSGTGGRGPIPFGPNGVGMSPLMGPLAAMFQGITGQRLGSGQQYHESPLRPQSAPGRRPGHPVEIYSNNGPGGYVMRGTNASGGPFHPGQGSQELPPEFNDIIQQIFGRGLGTGFAEGGRGEPATPNPFAAIFGSLFNPMNAQHGDAVFSQEAFDRVMTQLMEQHVSGSAPGPASQSAINALPKQKLTYEMLDESTGLAECSICMENVAVGELVTRLPCGHWFHPTCIEAWLREHDTCPHCRAGISPKEGSRDTVRSPTEPPLHDQDPFMLARRESGTRDHPFVVPDSPESARRRPSDHPRGSGPPSPTNLRRQSSRDDGGGNGGGITDRVRNFFTGGSNGPRR